MHHDANGRIALIPAGSDRYRELAADPALHHVSAMRSSRAFDLPGSSAIGIRLPSSAAPGCRATPQLRQRHRRERAAQPKGRLLALRATTLVDERARTLSASPARALRLATLGFSSPARPRSTGRSGSWGGR
ncbi:DUF6157 family protein [Saccharopolyspora aridisoli]|uniref:DUF6157 family protein n=1 Tax=Saccharopolyspora aridisoli TaxID=2530385 RepID=UPI0038B58AEB